MNYYLIQKKIQRLTLIIIISILVMLSGITNISVNAQETTSQTSQEEIKYNKYQEEFYYFDTYILLSLYSDKEIPQEHWDILDQLMQEIEFTFSRTDPESELYKLNQKAGTGPVVVSDNLFFVIKTAIEYAAFTQGKFEPTIGPLVEAWGINTESPKVPSDEDIANLKQLVDYRLVTLNEANKTVELEKTGMILDLGGIAKGYAADYLGEKVKDLGYKSAILNLGGNILTIGQRPEKNYKGNYNWAVGITNPKKIDLTDPYKIDDDETDDVLANVFVIDKTVVISGTYERYWVNEGKFYHHILDPNTGYPAGTSREEFDKDDLSSVAIITDSSTIADALSTSIFTLGLEGGMELINSLDNVEALFTTYGGDIFYSNQFEELYDIELLIENNNSMTKYIVPIAIGVGLILLTGVGFIIYKKYKAKVKKDGLDNGSC
ncbi:MAG: apbE [Haloplasmataceae bacterium]|jgi:thiamine biosynthesis lipoprotein|nr:apbE [Haloplasmataceae bacterium]